MTAPDELAARIASAHTAYELNSIVDDTVAAQLPAEDVAELQALFEQRMRELWPAAFRRAS